MCRIIFGEVQQVFFQFKGSLHFSAHVFLEPAHLVNVLEHVEKQNQDKNQNTAYRS